MGWLGTEFNEHGTTGVVDYHRKIVSAALLSKRVDTDVQCYKCRPVCPGS